MTNILVEGFAKIPSVYLSFHDFERIAKIVGSNIRCKIIKDITLSDIDWCDLFISIRGRERSSSLLAEKCKKSGRLVAYVIDDDLLCDYTGKSKFRASKDNKWINRILRHSDIIISSNFYLLEKYCKKYNLRGCRIDSVVDPEDCNNEWNNQDSIIHIVYAAGSDHGEMFNTIVAPALLDLHPRIKSKIDLTVIGPEIESLEYGFKVIRIPSMPFAEYNAFMKKNYYDIGLAPLSDNDFSRCKYINKYLEYAKRGSVGIFSDVLPYCQVIRENITGKLASNKQEWIDAINLLVEDDKIRQIIQMKTKEELLNYRSDVVAKSLIEQLPEFSSYICDTKIKSIRLFLLKYYYYYECILYKLWSIFEKMKRKMGV